MIVDAMSREKKKSRATLSTDPALPGDCVDTTKKNARIILPLQGTIVRTFKKGKKKEGVMKILGT